MSDLNPQPRIHVGEAFAGRSILLLGGTGFLGKICLGMLLEFFPEISRVYLMVRAAGEAESRIRFDDIIQNSPAFSPLRERHGTGLRNFLNKKIIVLGGDITSDNLGYSEEQAAEVAKNAEAIVVGSAIVNQIADKGCAADLVQTVKSFTANLINGIR